VWVAHWEVARTNYSRNYYMWQYTDSGRVSGISGGVDLNVGYRDFAAFIRRHGLNGLGGGAE
jgi:GH25 family lysozyme M1 (1,4-beta-N-acetylmuramidase)